MGLAILGLKNKSGFKICRIQRDLMVCGGLIFQGKALFGIGKYQFLIKLRRTILTYFNSKFSKNSTLFAENNSKYCEIIM